VQHYDKTVCAVGEKGGKRRHNLNTCSAINKDGALPYTEETTGRNNILG
jgi:hypothetical protein